MTHHSEDTLTHALIYAERGYHVFPVHGVKNGVCTCSKGATCTSIGKHPKTKNGVKDATTDEATIIGWFRNKPHTNVGIATGKVSGLFVVDVDPDKGGLESLAKLNLSSPMTVRTGSGGLHLYYTYDPTLTVGNSAGELAPGIDIRTTGGYVVAPPSLHRTGNYYTWEFNNGTY